MSRDIVTTDYEVKNELRINQGDVASMHDHLGVIKQFVSKSLNEGIDNDYGIIPGTPKKCLFKPGAEKLQKLFGLGVKFELLDKEVDRYENFAMYTYRATVFHLKTGQTIAECEACANSQERKYQKQKVSDILNTLMKMAQKRAMVGATIIATGASDYFTQDEDEINAQRTRANVDSSRFTEKPEQNLGEYVIPVGKFKDKRLGEIDRSQLTGYCQYITTNNAEIDGKMKEFIDTARDYLKAI